MQSPTQEITAVVKGLIEAPTADDQRSVLQRYFSPDASFDHPLCAVASYAGSRDGGLLPIYQWLRMLFTPVIAVDSVAFDQARSRLYIDARQTLRPNVFPVSLYTPTCRLIVLLDLHKGADGLFYIHRQQDYYEPQVMPGQLIPGGYSAINAIKLIIGVNCAILAWFTMTIIGYWKPTKKGIQGGKIVNGK